MSGERISFGWVGRMGERDVLSWSGDGKTWSSPLIFGSAWRWGGEGDKSMGRECRKPSMISTSLVNNRISNPTVCFIEICGLDYPAPQTTTSINTILFLIIIIFT